MSASASRSPGRSSTKPRLLLLDEPLAAVDVSARAGAPGAPAPDLATFAGPRVLVTHDPVEAMTLADRIVVLEDGRVTQTGTPPRSGSAPRTPYAADLVGVNLFVGALRPSRPAPALWNRRRDRDRRPGRMASLGTPSRTSSRPSRPADVALHTERPEGSPRNVLHGAIEEVAIHGDRARVRLRDVAARSSPRSRPARSSGCGSRAGVDVWASFKAVEVHLVVPTARTRYPVDVKTEPERAALESPEPDAEAAGEHPQASRPALQLGELPGLILLALILAMLIKTFLVQAFFIPSASMEKTLDIGRPRAGDEGPVLLRGSRARRHHRLLGARPARSPTRGAGRRRRSTGWRRASACEARQRGLHQARDRCSRRHGDGQGRQGLRERRADLDEPYLTQKTGDFPKIKVPARHATS